MRRWKPFVISLIALVVLAGAALACFKAYLASDLAALRFGNRLAALYGATVQVGRVDVGLSGSTLEGIQLYETGDMPGDEPWVVIKEAQLDLSFLDYVNGAVAPSIIWLREPVVTLRFDGDGKLLTRVPQPQNRGGPIPTLGLVQATVRIQQAGHADMIVGGIDGKIFLDRDGLHLNGNVSDGFWGDWDAQGILNLESFKGQLDLKSELTHVTQTKLEALPFVSPTVWEAVQLEGDTPVEFTFTYDLQINRFGYRVDLQPTNTYVRVACIQLSAEKAVGRVHIENGTILLHDVSGQIASGTIHTKAELSCRQEPKDMHFEIAVSDVDLSKLPKTWKFPREVSGKLGGNAELRVVVANQKPKAMGKGEGLVREAHLIGIKIHDFAVSMSAVNGVIHFSSHISGKN